VLAVVARCRSAGYDACRPAGGGAADGEPARRCPDRARETPMTKTPLILIGDSAFAEVAYE
jgi:hypothetical protein